MNDVEYTIEEGIITMNTDGELGKRTRLIRIRDISCIDLSFNTVSINVNGYVIVVKFTEDYNAVIFLADIEKEMINANKIKRFNFHY